MQHQLVFGPSRVKMFSLKLLIFVSIYIFGQVLCRDGKLLSLFSIVQFKQTGCASSASLVSGSGNRNGTCKTQAECNRDGGSAQGSCASGFGVCCVFVYSEGSTEVYQNCSYIQNPGFPSPYDSNSDITYTVVKCSSDVCALRLDFESFTILGIASSTEIAEGICQDTFEVTTTSGQNIPIICGENTGSHIYVDLGANSGDSATLDFSFGPIANSNQRIWDIKVTQVPCGAIYAPASSMWSHLLEPSTEPPGCLQYHTGLTGRFNTFNFSPTNENHLPDQQYSICIRQEEGFCCIQYQVCQDVENGFTISTGAGDDTAFQDTDCTLDYIAISDSSQNCDQSNANNVAVDNRYCGAFLNNMPGAKVNAPVCDCTQPFVIDVWTDGLADDGSTTATNTMPSRGVCLEWYQIPCSG